MMQHKIQFAPTKAVAIEKEDTNKIQPLQAAIFILLFFT
jgi:hypothetical protein